MNTPLPTSVVLVRHPLNARMPRTLREAARDPYDWVTGPHRGAKPTRAERAAGAGLAVAMGAMLAALVLRWWAA